jgi:hypothetical protein
MDSIYSILISDRIYRIYRILFLVLIFRMKMRTLNPPAAENNPLLDLGSVDIYIWEFHSITGSV